MKHLPLLFWLVCVACELGATARAYGHGFAGARFFPATLSTDDPFVADELSLPTVSTIRTPDNDGTRQTDISVDIAKRITPNFGIEIGEKPFHVRVSGTQRVALKPQSVGGTDTGRAVIRMRLRQRCFLVRQRDIRPDISARAHLLHERREPFRRHCFAPILGIQPILFDPVIVNQRGAGMRGRPADHACGAQRFGHAA